MSNFLSKLVKWVMFGIIVAVMIIVSTILSYSFGQITFTEAELLKLAEHNTERIYLKNLSVIQNAEIDSLKSKCDLQEQALTLCTDNQKDLQKIILKLDEVDLNRQEQIKNLEDRVADRDKTIKKKEKAIKRWKIATPILVVGAFIGGLFL